MSNPKDAAEPEIKVEDNAAPDTIKTEPDVASVVQGVESPSCTEVKAETEACESASNETTDKAETSSPPENKLIIDAEDDVPTDFFDDFNNKDFLAGLDVVDTWEDSELDATKPIDGFNPEDLKESNQELKNEDKDSGVEKCDVSVIALSSDEEEKAQKSPESLPSKEVESSTNTDDKLKSYTIPKKKSKADHKEQNHILRDASPVSKHSRRQIDENRRDPDKVKRDIQRDKARREKERINEKLRMVETGLVPPGTEMDIPDPSETVPRKSSEQKSQEGSSRDRKDVPRPLKRRLSRSPSPYRPKRRYSRSRSLVKRRPYRPPTRSRSRSPLHSDYGRYENRRRRHRTRSRSRSASPARRYHKLPDLRPPFKKSYERSRSPEVRKQSFLEELESKLGRKDHDHYKKIQAKLNGETSFSIHSHALNPLAPVHPMMQTSMPMPAVPIVPAPMAPMDMNSYGGVVYDQSYFIGPGVVMDANPYNLGYNQPQIPQQSSCYEGIQHGASSYEKQVDSTEETNRKLFKDESISLTKYLKLTQRSDNAEQISLSNKVKVLNQCQETLTLISSLQRPNGRFYCNVSRLCKQKKNKETSNSDGSSPFSGSMINFRFSSKQETKEMQPTPLKRLLARLSVKEKTVKMPAVSKVQVKTYEHAGSQTSDTECEECAIRKRRKYENVGVQCMPDTMEFGAQVTEDDFLVTARNALKHLLKHQSFASLTPAQILAQLSDKDDKPKARSEESEERRSSGDFERRERTADYERRSDWQYPAGGSPQKPAAGYASPQASYPRPLLAQPVLPPRPLLQRFAVRTAQPGPSLLGQVRGPGLLPRGYPNPSAAAYNPYIPKTMGNYPMRRFN